MHRDTLIQKFKQLVSIAHYETRNIDFLKTLFLNQKYIYEIHIGSCEKAKVPFTASWRVSGLFILGLGTNY